MQGLLISHMFVLIAFILGAALASFINVVAQRTLEGRPWWGSERSVCEACNATLSTRELIPVISWLLQKGKCRSCGVPLSARYLVVELIGGGAFAFLALRWDISWAFLLSAVGVVGLLLNALTDYESGDIFDIFALATGIAGITVRSVGGIPSVLAGVLGALTGWAIFALIIMLTRGGMGWGDACFMAGIGTVLGWKLTLLGFYFGILAGGVGVAVLMLQGKVRWGRGDSIPLVPYLAMGCYLTLLFGSQILVWMGKHFGAPQSFIPPWPFI